MGVVNLIPQANNSKIVCKAARKLSLNAAVQREVTSF